MTDLPANIVPFKRAVARVISIQHLADLRAMDGDWRETSARSPACLILRFD